MVISPLYARPGLMMNAALKKLISRIEHYTVMALLIMMMLVIVVSTVELAIMLYQDLTNPPLMLFNISELMGLFGFFFMILIGLELVETIKMYLDESKIHVEVVFLVAMIAVARKVIILDAKSQDWTTLLAVAAVILALSLGYYLFKLAPPPRQAQGAERPAPWLRPRPEKRPTANRALPPASVPRRARMAATKEHPNQARSPMYAEEYKRKLVSPEQAALAVPDGGALIHGLTMAEPPALLNAIAQRVASGGLGELTVYSLLPTETACKSILAPELAGAVKAYTWFVSACDRELVDEGVDDFIPCHFHQVPRLIDRRAAPGRVRHHRFRHGRPRLFQPGHGQRLHLHRRPQGPQADRGGEPQHAQGLRPEPHPYLRGGPHRGEPRAGAALSGRPAQGGGLRHRQEGGRDDPRRGHPATGGGQPARGGGRLPHGPQGPGGAHRGVRPHHGQADQGRGHQRAAQEHPPPSARVHRGPGGARTCSSSCTTTPPWPPSRCPT